MSDPKKQLAGAVVALGATITEAMDAVPGFVQHVSEHRGVTAHQVADVDALSAEQSQLAQKVVALATSAEAASLDPARTEWMYRALGALEPGSAKAADLLTQA